MATIDSLANETLIHIIELLKAPSDRDQWSTERQKGRYDSLRAAALVCARWRDPAQRALFDEIHLQCLDREGRRLFCASTARPRYRTRSLCAQSNGPPGGPNTWITVAKACTGLESLTVLEHGHSKEGGNSDWAELLHSAYHGLKHLSLMYPEHFIDPEDTSTTLPFRLTSLSLWLDNHGRTSLHFLHALTTSSLSSLEILSLRLATPIAVAHFASSFLLLGPHLRTLVLGASHEAFKDHYHDTITSLTSLRRLEIDLGWLYRGDLINGLDFLSTVLDNLPDPPSLKHLVIKSTGPPPKALLTVLEHKKLLMIEELVWCAVIMRKHEAMNEWESSDGVEATRRVCEERGIRLEIVDERD